MGVQLTELLKQKEINIKELSGKVIAVDASLFLYQFISTIRQRDGAMLMDSKGNVTSHLTGLFSRTVNLLSKGLKLVFVFDGKPPELKRIERERRKRLKDHAMEQYNEASAKGDVANMRKFASRTSYLTKSMVLESKELISAMGLPIVQAPSEAEAQASYMAKKGDCYAVATQDSDTLLFGAPLLIRNLSMLGKRKKYKTLGYTSVKPELINLAETLNEIGIDHDQLIVLSMLIGTDYNVGGIKGIGPKNAVKMVKRYEKDFDSLFKEVKWDTFFDFSWTDVYYQIKKIEVTDDYILSWKRFNELKIKEILVARHEFSEERIESTISKVKQYINSKKQKSLFDF